MFSLILGHTSRVYIDADEKSITSHHHRSVGISGTLLDSTYSCTWELAQTSAWQWVLIFSTPPHKLILLSCLSSADNKKLSIQTQKQNCKIRHLRICNIHKKFNPPFDHVSLSEGGDINNMSDSQVSYNNINESLFLYLIHTDWAGHINFIHLPFQNLSSHIAKRYCMINQSSFFLLPRQLGQSVNLEPWGFWSNQNCRFMFELFTCNFYVKRALVGW